MCGSTTCWANILLERQVAQTIKHVARRKLAGPNLFEPQVFGFNKGQAKDKWLRDTLDNSMIMPLACQATTAQTKMGGGLVREGKFYH